MVVVKRMKKPYNSVSRVLNAIIIIHGRIGGE